MAKKKKAKKVEEVIEEVVNNYKSGDIIEIPHKELPGNVLGGVYKYNDLDVRVVYINEICKLEVL